MYLLEEEEKLGDGQRARDGQRGGNGLVDLVLARLAGVGGEGFFVSTLQRTA